MTKHQPRAVPLGAVQFIEAILRQFGFHTYVPPDGRAVEMVRERDTRMRSQGARGVWPHRRKSRKRKVASQSVTVIADAGWSPEEARRHVQGIVDDTRTDIDW